MKFLYIYTNLYHFKIFFKYFKWDENKFKPFHKSTMNIIVAEFNAYLSLLVNGLRSLCQIKSFIVCKIHIRHLVFFMPGALLCFLQWIKLKMKWMTAKFMWRLMSSGAYHIVWQICTNVSDESTTSSFYLKDEDSRFLHSTGNYLLNHTALHPRRW